MVKKIYATSDVDRYDFKKGDGAVEIYNSTSSDYITFSDIGKTDAGNILKFSTSNGKDLIITRNDSKKDKIVLKDWFTSYDNKLDIFKFSDSVDDSDFLSQMDIGLVNVSGKGTIYDTKSEDVITGSKKADKIYSNYGNDMVIAGKGNDYIEFKDNYKNTVVLNKGDGNDKVKINNSSSSTYINFAGDVDISYTKDGNNLIITGKHTGKKSKTESVTILDYFKDNGAIGNLNVYVSDDIEKNIYVKNAVPYALNIKAEKLKEIFGTFYSFEGTQYDDIFRTINNKYNEIYTENGNNIVITSKKGLNDIYGGNGNDTYIINSLKALNIIGDQGGEDLLELKGVNSNDLYLLSDVETSSEYKSDTLLLTNGKGANKLKKFKIKEYDNEFSLLKRNINGVLLDLNFGNMEIENVIISKGDDVEIVQGIDDVLSVLENDIRAYLQSLKIDGSYKYESALDLLLYGSKKERSTLVNLYKNYRIGTNGDNSYTINGAKTYIASGEGNDSFTFKGKFGDTIINSITDSETNDKITVKNYAVEKNNLSLYLSDNGKDLLFEASEWNKKTKTTDVHTITYKNFQTVNNDLILKDSKREYKVLYSDNGLNANWSEEKTNHIVYSYGDVGVSVNLSKGYNNIEVNQGTNNVQNRYFYNGGHDIINSYSQNSNDEYNINVFDKNTDLFIFDNGGDDKLIINANLDDVRIFMNINKNEEVVTMDGEHMNWFVTDKSNMSIKSVKNGLNGIEIGGQTDCIETLKIGDTAIDVDKWIDGVKHNVGSWLSTYKNGKYADVMSVISGGSKSDITALIAKFNEVDYNHAQDYVI